MHVQINACPCTWQCYHFTGFSLWTIFFIGLTAGAMSEDKRENSCNSNSKSISITISCWCQIWPNSRVQKCRITFSPHSICQHTLAWTVGGHSAVGPHSACVMRAQGAAYICMLVSLAELLKEISFSWIHIRVSLRWRDVTCLGNGFISRIEFVHYVILISADTSGSYTGLNRLVAKGR